MEAGTLKFRKKVDEVEEAVLMPEDYYVMRVILTPKLAPNKAKAKDKEDPKAGDNWEIDVAVISDVPEFNGRKFRLFMAYPSTKDENEYTSRGQCAYDAKMENIIKVVQAFEGFAEGDTVTLPVGATARLPVVQKPNRQTGVMENQVNIFGELKTTEGNVVGRVDVPDLEDFGF